MSEIVSLLSEVDLAALGRAYFSVWSKDSKAIEIDVSVNGHPTDDHEKNQKACVIGLQWFDKNGSELDEPVRGYTKSPKFGTFRYLELTELSGNVQFTLSLTAPSDAFMAGVRIWRFANPSLTLEALTVRRAR